MASQFANPQVAEIKTVPYVPLSHPFVERLIETIRREYLDCTLFWTTVDLENKLLEFRDYFNSDRTHHSLAGRTPDRREPRLVANLNSYRWQIALSKPVSDTDRCVIVRSLRCKRVNLARSPVQKPFAG